MLDWLLEMSIKLVYASSGLLYQRSGKVKGKR